MATRDRVSLEGLDELKRTLHELGPEVATKVGAQSTRKVAVELAQLLIPAAPYDEKAKKKYWRLKSGEVNSRDYGHLRDNIKVRKARGRRQYTITFIVSTTHAFWANFLEWGTRTLTAQPWMRPVVDAAAPRLRSAQIENLTAAIERTAKRLARLRAKAGK